MFHKFFIDPRPVTLDTVFKKITSTQRAGVGELRLVIDVRSCQRHLTLNAEYILPQTRFFRGWLIVQQPT